MQSTAVHTISAVAANEGAVKAQIAALRESLKKQRNRARNLWEACAPDAEETGEARIVLGQFTAKFLKGQNDAACS